MKKNHWVWGLGVALACLLTACAPKEDQLNSSASSAKSTAATALTIGTMSAPESIPLYVAQAAGYFKQADLDVTLKMFKSPKERDAAVSAGALDGAVSDVVTLASYVNGDLGWQSGSGLTGSFGILTNQPDIQSLKDLAGRTVATMPRQTPTFYLYQALAKAGLSQADVKVTEVAQVPARVQLCVDRKVDAIIVPDPFMAMAKAKGCRVIAQSDPAHYQTTIMAFAPKVAKDAAVRRRFYTAYNRAVAKLNAGTAADFKSILVDDIGYPAAVLADVKLLPYTKAKAIPTATLKAAFEYAHREGVLKTAVDPSRYSLQVQAN
ncbi:ABC transporter substrate-binding protein [Lacticaseibacillus absianus]|uniref:ABC transporter substrate-binding protein n=1 Tax=Lacticaseibacillus absianus TaxID=2729623 RepID=UPI0015CC6B9C|nr:ABC transporter substrate-binding protein [Lacticaseibacillus absianus]